MLGCFLRIISLVGMEEKKDLPRIDEVLKFNCIMPGHVDRGE